MDQTRMLLSLAVVYLLGSATVSHAAVYDLGSLTAASTVYSASPRSFTQLAAKGNVFGKWVPDENAGTDPFNCVNDSLSMGQIGRSIPYAPGASKRGAGFNGRLSSSISYISLHGINGSHAEERQPIAAVHEPDLYVMVAAGFALLFLSARRRKSDTFD